MSGNIKTKSELYTAFADNNSGDITPQDVRDFVASNLGFEEQRLNAPGAVIDFLTDICFLEAGCNQVFIPQYVNYGTRTLRLVNRSGSDVQVDTEPGGTIGGVSPYILAPNATIEVSPNPSPLAWDINLLAEPVGSQRILSSFSLAADQFPGATDTPLQIEFGGAQSETQMDLSAAGEFTCSVAGTYRFDLVVHFGRTSNVGELVAYFNALVNGSVVGVSIFIKVNSQDDSTPISASIEQALEVGDIVTFEITLDSTSNTNGGLVSLVPTLAGRPIAPTARCNVDKL